MAFSEESLVLRTALSDMHEAQGVFGSTFRYNGRLFMFTREKAERNGIVVEATITVVDCKSSLIFCSVFVSMLKMVDYRSPAGCLLPS